ncbi:hypothetical protein NLG97_g9585 [Lecanicillium saksenae]|uniref:Uncharacterized protein n=1 Tax=Lecanicillium saksenae TaxID=468837 RepID=A0ACC1QFL2_9HYPO|nr:hypothetical protein NLG97_g9585 [Lecanicillium saksenae]
MRALLHPRGQAATVKRGRAWKDAASSGMSENDPSPTLTWIFAASLELFICIKYGVHQGAHGGFCSGAHALQSPPRPSNGPTYDGRVGIDIRIANHYAAKIYTTGSPVTGEAIIRVPRDTHFDRVAIQFVGLAATRNYMTPEIDKVLHHFLLLDMPLKEITQLPWDGFLRAGETCTVPFHFVVPESLPIGSCGQRCEHPLVREHHLRLPPSMGAWGDRDDGCPETSRVQYCVAVSILQRTVFSPEPVSVLRCRQEVNVLPAYAEDAPLDVRLGDKKGEYKLMAATALRRSLLSRKLGTVTVAAPQPGAVVLSADAREASHVKMSFSLKFVPAARLADNLSTDEFFQDTACPSVHSITAKLVAKTYYNTSHMGAFPDRDRRHELNFGASLYYTDTSRATAVPFDSAQDWRVLKQEDGARAWALDLDAAFQLPVDQKKILLPSFHSCILSRTYTLRLSLAVGPGRSTISLSLPLQIIVDGGMPVVSQLPPGMSRRGQHDVALPKYKDHVFGQRCYEDEMDTHVPAANVIIM